MRRGRIEPRPGEGDFANRGRCAGQGDFAGRGVMCGPAPAERSVPRGLPGGGGAEPGLSRSARPPIVQLLSGVCWLVPSARPA